MAELVIDEATIAPMLSQIESLVSNSRAKAQEIIARYDALDTYDDLMHNKNLPFLYGQTADDYSKLCFLVSGAVDAVMDLKKIKKALVSMSVPSVARSYKTRVDTLIDSINDFKESSAYAKSGLEARVRYLSSMAYTSYDKSMGARC